MSWRFRTERESKNHSFKPNTSLGPVEGEHYPMSQVKTGPRKTSDKTRFVPFMPEDIRDIWEQAAAKDRPIFAGLLDAAILERGLLRLGQNDLEKEMKR